jgi:hypothetical protein
VLEGGVGGRGLGEPRWDLEALSLAPRPPYSLPLPLPLPPSFPLFFQRYFLEENYVVGDVMRTPDMGSSEFLALNYSAKKQYNVQGLDWQLESIYPTIGLATLFNRTIIVSRELCGYACFAAQKSGPPSSRSPPFIALARRCPE